MLRQSLKFSWAFILFGVFLFTACDEESLDLTTDETSTEDFVDESLYSLQSSGNIGRFGCYELVFPVTIVFPDSTTATGESYEEIIAFLQAWIEANPDATEWPTFAFPIEVLTEEGELISVTTEEELWELKQACRGSRFGSHGSRGHRDNCTSCFEIVYPITIQFPDETTAEAASRESLKELVRAWKEANPDATERPEVVFPIEVEMEDETIVTVASQEELRELRESCN